MKDGRARQIVSVPVSRLRLDPENPRLAGSAEDLSQPEILERLWEEMAVDELVLSIAANGYFPEEPLFVVPDPEGADPEEEDVALTVIEGNRRFAAVLILLHDDYREKLRVTNMPEISPADKDDLTTLPVSIYPKREDLWAFLSFRHINAAMPWDAYSKAKYVAQVHDEYSISLEEIAERIGDRHSTVQRLYRGYKVLQQAEQTGAFDVDDRAANRFYFSHLYTALTYKEYQTFLGVDRKDLSEDDPVPDSHLPQLGLLMEWLFGSRSKRKEPIIRRQNPDLNLLREVIGNEAALDALKEGFSLDRSHQISVGDEKRFRQSMTAAKENLQQAKATVTTGYQGQETPYTVLQDIQRIVAALDREMGQARTDTLENAR